MLAALLRKLLDEKLLVDEMSPLDKHDKGKDSATFLGVAQPDGPGTVYRRIDFKVSCAQSLHLLATSAARCRLLVIPITLGRLWSQPDC